MKSKKPQTVHYRRKREQRTNYAKRRRLLLSQGNRLVLRFTASKVIAQIIAFTPQGDKVLIGVDSSSLRKEGWNYSLKNTPAAYLTGFMLGKNAVKAGVNDAVFDAGFKSPRAKGKSYGFLKGVLDAGFHVPCGEKDIFPSEERITGKHISDFAAKNKNGVQFAQYLKSKAVPEQITTQFKAIKQKLGGK